MESEIEMWKRIVAKNHNPAGYQSLGIAQVDAGLFQEALSSFEKAGTSPIMYYYMGKAKEGLRDYSGAEKCFEQAIDIPSSEAKDHIQIFYLQRAKTIFLQGETKKNLHETLAFLTQGLKFGETNVSFLQKMGDIHHLLSKLETDIDLRNKHRDEYQFCFQKATMYIADANAKKISDLEKEIRWELDQKKIDIISFVSSELEQRYSSFPQEDKQKVLDYLKSFQGALEQAFITSQTILSDNFQLSSTGWKTDLFTFFVSFVPLAGDLLSSAVAKASEIYYERELISTAQMILNIFPCLAEVQSFVDNHALEMIKDTEKVSDIINSSSTSSPNQKATRLWDQTKKLAEQLKIKFYGGSNLNRAMLLGKEVASSIIQENIKLNRTYGSNQSNSALVPLANLCRGI